MSRPDHTHRRDFLKLSALAGLGLGALAEAKPDPAQLKHRSAADMGTPRPRPAGNKPVWDLRTKPQEKIRVGIIGLNRGRAHVASCVATPFVEVVALCDILEERAQAQAEVVRKKTGRRRRPTAVTKTPGRNSSRAMTSTSCTSPLLGNGTSRWPSARWNSASTPSSK
jgi:hypothetical protein